MIEGCEPYSFDFGEREFVAWLERYLTPAELTERNRRWERYLRVDPLMSWSWSHSVVKTRLAFAVRVLLWPARRWALRRVRAIEELARERGGDPPGPSWKIRHEFGTPADS